MMVRSKRAACFVVAIIGVVILVGCSGRSAASSGKASAELVAAAEAVGFKPSLGPGMGQIENLPASSAAATMSKNLLPVGAAAPDFRLKTATGVEVSLGALRGKAVLVEFFATWCPHCQAEAPHLANLSKELAASKYAVLAINADGEDAPSVYAFDHFYDTPYPVLLDPSAVTGSFHNRGAIGPVSAAYKIEFLPTFYVIAPDGTVAWRSDGEQPDALLRGQLQAVAKEG